MPKKESNFVSMNLPKYLINDVEQLITSDRNLRMRTSRAGVVCSAVDDYLDRKSFEREKNFPKDKKSARTRRYELVQWFDNLTMKEIKEDDMAEESFGIEYQELSREIETAYNKKSKK